MNRRNKRIKRLNKAGSILPRRNEEKKIMLMESLREGVNLLQQTLELEGSDNLVEQ